MRLNRVVRQIHFVSSMIMLSFMLVFVTTGLFMINHDLFSIPEIKVTHSTLPAGEPMRGDPKDYARYLKKTLDIRGRMEYRQDKQNNWIFYFNIPGEAYQVKLPPARDSLYIQKSTQEMTPYMVAHRIHILRGFRGGWEYTAWAVMYDVTCFAMILFAITGIIMWHKRRKQFRRGWWYLLAGILIPVLFIYAFVLWK
jgi:hypothetical protein